MKAERCGHDDELREFSWHRAMVSAAMFLVTLCSSAGADTHYVSAFGNHVHPYTTWQDAATNIQIAVSTAASGDEVLISNGIYYVAETVVVTQGIYVAGFGDSSNTIIDGMDLVRCFYLDNSNAQLARLTLRNGKAEDGGGVLCSNGLVRNCILTENTAELNSPVSGGRGGGAFIGAGGVISNTTVYGNTAHGKGMLPGGGGGIFCRGGLVVDCIVSSNNTDGAGGGIASERGGRVWGCEVRYNEAAQGGGIACTYTGFVEHCTVADNVAESGGGIAALWESTVAACIVERNTATVSGGGVYAWNATVGDCFVRENSASDAAGAFCMEGELSGMGNPDGTTTLFNCILNMNSAVTNGGGIGSIGGTIQNCTITRNAASVTGGGMFCISNTTVRNVVAYDNSAPTDPNATTGDPQVEYTYTCSFPVIPGAGNMGSDPMLTPSGRLKSASPCIDAGTSLNAPPTDIDGEARWDHPSHPNIVSTIDIGADEFVDGDSDNMGDHWETETFGSTTNSNGSADGDDDGLNDLGEYENGTDVNSGDTDSDSIPDGWEVHNDLDPLADDADQDPDADTMNNGGEYVADTDPQDGNSVLSIMGISPERGGIRIDWKGGQRAWQILERRSGLLSTGEQWTGIVAIPPMTPMTNKVIDIGVTNGTLFYRIRAER